MSDAQTHYLAGLKLFGEEQHTAAIAEYERYLADPWIFRWIVDPAYRPAALESLGRLYDAQADAANAAKYYGMFVDLWANADETLQTRVAAARARLVELGSSE